MKFGYYVRSPLTYPEIRDLTQRIDKMGFDSAHVNDHLIGFDKSQDKREPYLESMMLMSSLAVETKNIKLGHIVLCNSFRNPAYLAKMISTLDHISNGRALMWLGAGWYEEEYKAYGYPFPSAKRRVDELEESLQIYKKMFTEDSTDFKGKFWTLENNRNYPKPVQEPWPQIVLGTAGNRMLKIAAREVDGANLPYTKWDETKERITYIREMLTKFNRNLDEFEISMFNSITLEEDQDALDSLIDKIIKRSADKKPTKEEVLKDNLIGFPEDIKNKLDKLEEMGIDKMVFTVRKSQSIEDPLKVFYDKVM